MLLVPLALPPNILDEFQLCRGHRLSYPQIEVDQAQDQLAAMRQRAEEAEAQLAAIYGSRLWSLARLLTAGRCRLKTMLSSRFKG